MNNIGIIGYGFVGQAAARGFASSKKNKIFWYDKFKKSPFTLNEVIKESEFIFVTVPTPMKRDYTESDMSIVEEVLDSVGKKIQGTEKILILKSTSLPGTTAKFAKKYPKVHFAMNPEFLVQRTADRDFLFPTRTVIGVSEKKVGERIKKLYQTILPKDQEYFFMDTTAAELAKYMANVMNASKVLLANEFYFLAKKTGVDYEVIKKSVMADKRVGEFMDVPGWDGDFGFGGACFPKDVLALIAFAKKIKVDVSALEAIWQKNLKIRKKREWEKMDNAFGRGASKK